MPGQAARNTSYFSFSRLALPPNSLVGCFLHPLNFGALGQSPGSLVLVTALIVPVEQAQFQSKDMKIQKVFSINMQFFVQEKFSMKNPQENTISYQVLYSFSD